MSVYVDNLCYLLIYCGCCMKMCYMVVDFYEEMYDMVLKFGVRCYFQDYFKYFYYDICVSNREKVIFFGVVFVDSKILFMKFKVFIWQLLLCDIIFILFFLLYLIFNVLVYLFYCCMNECGWFLDVGLIFVSFIICVF